MLGGATELLLGMGGGRPARSWETPGEVLDGGGGALTSCWEWGGGAHSSNVGVTDHWSSCWGW